jgi:hypothetical protein
MRALRAFGADPALRLAAAGSFGLSAGIASFAPYASLVAKDTFGITAGTYSVVLGVAATVAVVAATGIGILTDQRANRRVAAVTCAALWLMGAALVAIVRTPWAFILAHAVFLPAGGALFGQFFVLARIAAGTLEPADRDAVLAALRAIFALPFLCVLPVWSAAVAAGVPLIWVYTATLAAAMAVLILVLRGWPRDEGRFRPPPSGLSAGAALAEIGAPEVMLRLLATGLVKSGVALYLVVLGLMVAGAGRSAGDVALFAGLVAGLEVPVMLSIGALLARVSKTRLIAAATLVHAGFLLALAPLAPTPAFWALVVPAALGAGIILSVPIGYLQDLMDGRPGAGGALIALQQFLGDIFAAAAFAAGVALSGYGAAAAIGAAFAIAGGMGLLWLDRGGKPRIGAQAEKNPFGA